jgi:hypothetical protein
VSEVLISQPDGAVEVIDVAVEDGALIFTPRLREPVPGAV